MNTHNGRENFDQYIKSANEYYEKNRRFLLEDKINANELPPEQQSTSVINQHRGYLKNYNMLCNIELKQKFIDRMMIGVAIYMVIVLGLVAVNYISDSVIITLLSTTTVNVLGILYVIAKAVVNHDLSGDAGKNSE